MTDFEVDTEQLDALGGKLDEIVGQLRASTPGQLVSGTVSMPGFKTQEASGRLAEALNQEYADLADRFQWNADLAHEHARNYGDVEAALAQRIEQVQDRIGQGGRR